MPVPEIEVVAVEFDDRATNVGNPSPDAEPVHAAVTTVAADGPRLGIARAGGLISVQTGATTVSARIAPRGSASLVDPGASLGGASTSSLVRPRAIAFHQDTLWTVTPPPSPQRLIGLDASSLRVVEGVEIASELRDADQLTIVDGRFFAGATSGSRRVIVELADSGVTILSAGATDPPFGDSVLRRVDDELWLIVRDHGRLCRIDPVRDRVVGDTTMDAGHERWRLNPFEAGMDGRLLAIRRPRWGHDVATDLVIIGADGQISPFNPGEAPEPLAVVLSAAPHCGAVAHDGRLLFGMPDGRVVAVTGGE